MLLHRLDEGVLVAHRLGGHDGRSHNLPILFVWGAEGHSLGHIWVGQQGPIHLAKVPKFVGQACMGSFGLPGTDSDQACTC